MRGSDFARACDDSESVHFVHAETHFRLVPSI